MLFVSLFSVIVILHGVSPWVGSVLAGGAGAYSTGRQSATEAQELCCLKLVMLVPSEWNIVVFKGEPCSELLFFVPAVIRSGTGIVLRPIPDFVCDHFIKFFP